MTRVHSITAITLAGLVGLGTICAPIAASASEEGKRNTAYALGAAALGLLLTQKNKLPGLLAAGGAAYAYSQYNNDVQARHRWEQGGYYYNDRNNNRNNDHRYHQDSHWNNRDNGSQSYWNNDRNNRNSDHRDFNRDAHDAH